MVEAAEQAARWLAEAIETGNPLAALPEEVAPRDLASAEAIAFATLEALGLVPCGVRLLRRPGAATLAGPMLEARLVAPARPIATAALRHPLVTAAVIGVLAEPLDADGAAPPVLARLHPALDVSATRYSGDGADDLALTADLARLGLVVSGRGKVQPPGPVRATLAPKGRRGAGTPADLAAAFAEAAATARAWGGLPAGGLLVIAGLSPPMAAEGRLRASLGGLGAVEASFAGPD
jgi:hypothetical protein